MRSSFHLHPSSVAYIDPGNLASDINQGVQAGYTLIWVTLWCTVLVSVAWQMRAWEGSGEGGVRCHLPPSPSRQGCDIHSSATCVSLPRYILSAQGTRAPGHLYTHANISTDMHSHSLLLVPIVLFRRALSCR